MADSPIRPRVLAVAKVGSRGAHNRVAARARAAHQQSRPEPRAFQHVKSAQNFALGPVRIYRGKERGRRPAAKIDDVVGRQRRQAFEPRLCHHCLAPLQS